MITENKHKRIIGKPIILDYRIFSRTFALCVGCIVQTFFMPFKHHHTNTNTPTPHTTTNEHHTQHLTHTDQHPTKENNPTPTPPHPTTNNHTPTPPHQHPNTHPRITPYVLYIIYECSLVRGHIIWLSQIYILFINILYSDLLSTYIGVM